MYQDEIDQLVFPFGKDDVAGFGIRDDAFWIDLKIGKPFKCFDLMEPLRKSEFNSICMLIARKLGAI